MFICTVNNCNNISACPQLWMNVYRGSSFIFFCFLEVALKWIVAWGKRWHKKRRHFQYCKQQQNNKKSISPYLCLVFVFCFVCLQVKIMVEASASHMIILCIKDHSSNHFNFLDFDVVPLSSSHFIQLIWVKQRPSGLIHKLQIIGVVKDGIAPFLEPTNGKGEKGKLPHSLQSGQLPGIVTRAVHASLQAKENAQNKWVWS